MHSVVTTKYSYHTQIILEQSRSRLKKEACLFFIYIHKGNISNKAFDTRACVWFWRNVRDSLLLVIKNKRFKTLRLAITISNWAELGVTDLTWFCVCATSLETYNTHMTCKAIYFTVSRVEEWIRTIFRICRIDRVRY